MISHYKIYLFMSYLYFHEQKPISGPVIEVQVLQMARMFDKKKPLNHWMVGFEHFKKLQLICNCLLMMLMASDVDIITKINRKMDILLLLKKNEFHFKTTLLIIFYVKIKLK